MRVAHLSIVLLCAVGCGDSAEDASPGTIQASPPSLDFGEVPVDERATLTFTLTHAGGGPVDVLSVSLVSGDPALWRLDRGDLTTLSDGLSAQVEVTFAPEDLGVASGRVQVRTSSADAPSLFVDLVGVGGPSTADEDGDGFSPATGDCDDGDDDRFPGADERCNGRDDDCDGLVPADEADEDFDGSRLCDGDCDDADEHVHPGAPEICDDKDSDCVGGAHDRDDLDGDGYTVCDADCDDAEDLAHPGALEVCDGVDNDCSGAIDDLDADQDGHSLCSVAGDCDDADPNAHPVLVTAAGSATGDGTPADPYDTIATALTGLDDVCRTVWIEPGVWEIAGTWTVGALTLRGGGADPSDVELIPVGYDRLLTVGAGGVVTLEGLTIGGGVASGDGGAVNVTNGGALTLRDVVARGNRSDTDGGAIAVSSGTLVLEGACVFEDNVALDDGGAISASSSTFLDLDGASYTGNAGSQGGAIYASGGTVQVVGAELRDNVAADEGGAIAIAGAGSYLLQGNRVVLNEAATAGGGIALRDVTDPVGLVRNNVVQDNVAGTVGGGIALTGTSASLLVANNTLVANTAPGEGAGLHVAPVSASGLRVWANLVLHSTGASGLYAAPGSTALVEYNTGYLTSSGTDFAGEAAVGLENQTRDPALDAVSPTDGDPDNDDLDLQPGSPEIDSGPPVAAMNDPDGTVNDRGATGGPGASP